MIHFEWPQVLAALKFFLVPMRCVGTRQGRATSCNGTLATRDYPLLLHAAQRADTAFPRSAWERERI